MVVFICIYSFMKSSKRGLKLDLKKYCAANQFLRKERSTAPFRLPSTRDNSQFLNKSNLIEGEKN